MLSAALAGTGRLLLVAGEAGMGKTTLVRSLAEDARDRGAVVRWGACWEGGSLLPFAAWIDALRRPGRDLCDEVVARLGDARAGQATDAASAARARSRLFDDVVDALEREAAGRPRSSSSRTSTGRTPRRSRSCGGWRPTCRPWPRWWP